MVLNCSSRILDGIHNRYIRFIVSHLMNGFEECGDLLARVSKHKTSKGCLYSNKLQDIDQSVPEELIGKYYLE